MVLLKRLWIEQARLGYKIPTTVEEVEASEKESNGIPNTCPVGCQLDGEAGIFALHNFTDGDVWLVRLADHSDDWVTQRVATDADKRTIKALYPSVIGPSGQSSDGDSQDESYEVTNQVFRAWWNRDSEQRRFLMGYQYGRGGTHGEPMLYLIDAAGQKVAFEIDQAYELIAALQHITNTTDSSDKGLPSFEKP